MSFAIRPCARPVGPSGWTWPVVVLGCLLALGGCGTFSGRSADRAPDSGKRGGYYLDDGPGDDPPANLDAIPDAVPRVEPLVRGTARPYSVMGRTYMPMTRLAPYRERGLATWYGRRYHGNRTASGEIYDMYAMTAAHPVLPIPSYARVTNLANGRSVVVRINDRGPFLGDRLIDLSYVAAYKLDILRNGSSPVEVEAILPGEEPAPPATLTVQAPTETSQTAAPVPAQPATEAPAQDSLEGTPQSAPPAQSAAIRAPNGFYVQLAAFSVPDNAQRFVERMRLVLTAAADNLTIVRSGNLHRVQAGPYSNRDEALEAAARMAESLGEAPVVVNPR